MIYGDRICELIQYMKRETIIGTVIVCGLIGVVNYIVRRVCNQAGNVPNKGTTGDDFNGTEQRQKQPSEETENEYSILERVVHLEHSLSELSGKKEELTKLNEQLVHIRNTLDSLKESLKDKDYHQ